MRNIRTPLSKEIGHASQALSDGRSLTIGITVAILAAVLFLVSGQMLTWDASGPVLLATAGKTAVFGVLALLVGLQGALQSYAVRLRGVRRGKIAGLGGLALAFVGSSCCVPLLWPAALSLAGVSGVTLLGVNAWLHQWFWVPVTLSMLALLVGIRQALRALASPCALPLPGADETSQAK